MLARATIVSAEGAPAKVEAVAMAEVAMAAQQRVIICEFYTQRHKCLRIRQISACSNRTTCAITYDVQYNTKAQKPASHEPIFFYNTKPP